MEKCTFPDKGQDFELQSKNHAKLVEGETGRLAAKEKRGSKHKEGETNQANK